MQRSELERLSAAIGEPVVAPPQTLAGGFSHETVLVPLPGRVVVARLGGPDPAIEAAVMAAARTVVPVPGVLCVVPAGLEPQARPAMVIEHVDGTPLSDVLADRDLTEADQRELGLSVGATAARIGAVRFDRPGFFADEDLSVSPMSPWSASLAEFAATCMESVPDDRLDPAARARWAGLCADRSTALPAVDDQARLVHADLNPKNLLVTRTGDGAEPGWRVDAVLDWEFSFAGCPYGDAANMVRFAGRYPAGFTEGFLTGFAGNQPPDLPLPPDWLYLGRVLDLFALSDLVTRPPGHEVADQAAAVISQWLASGGPA